MTFLLPTLLTLGLPIIAAPLIIHLINLRRRRRIEWAAMDFLRESQRRNRKWILLRQFLLLLLRTAAIALIVVMLAEPVATSAWARFLGRGVTHHMILLDDSYSMSDAGEGGAAIDRAKQAVATILQQADSQQESQLVTLLRFSEAAGLSAGAGPDIDRRPLDAALLDEIDGFLADLQPAESDAGPIEALQAAARLPEPGDDEARIAYVVSDFRRASWTEEAQLQQLFGTLRRQSKQLQLIQCVEQTHANLAITRLAPESGIRAAGIENWMELTVANYGDVAAAAVAVDVQQDGARLPAVQFDEVPAGELATRRFRVTFADPGAHQVSASLESDAVTIDNARYFAATIPADLPVLIIDGSERGDDGDYLRSALSPGGRNLAGWSPLVERVAFLRRHERLPEFAAIFLLDVPRLDLSEVAALEQYVAAGGGLALFLGPNTLPAFYNSSFYRDGEGLFPAPLDVPTQLLRDATEADADVTVAKHPLFRVFSGQRNSFLSVANVDFYYALAPGWSPADASNAAVIATLHNGAPFVLEKRWGEGRVVVQLCKLSPQPTELGSWSNWGVNPVFPVLANELVGYLSAARRTYQSLTSGDAIRLEVPEAEYDPEVRIDAPENAENATATATATVLATAEEGTMSVEAPGPSVSGVWSFHLQPRDGDAEQQLVAVNVPVGEGDLHHLDRSALKERLPNLDYQFSLASQLTSGAKQLAGFRLRDSILYLVLGALAVEQLVAVSASYHGRLQRRAA